MAAQTASDAYNGWLSREETAREDYPDVTNEQILTELNALRRHVQLARITRFEEMMSIKPDLSFQELMGLHEEIHAMLQLHGFARF